MKHFSAALAILHRSISLSRQYNHHHVPTDNLSSDKLMMRPQRQRKSTDKEFIFQNLENGISLFNAETLETKLLMDNSSFVSQNDFTFSSFLPDFIYICLVCGFETYSLTDLKKKNSST